MITVKGNQLTFHGKTYRCAIGKGGFSADKREGDGCTPIGEFPLRQCFYRSDRMGAPKTELPMRPIAERDGWCDDVKSTDYNRLIKRPYNHSHEQLWREDHVYDLIAVIGYNDNSAVPGRGSAIFMHLAKDHYEPTEGCVALARADLLEVLALCDNRTVIDIRGE